MFQTTGCFFGNNSFASDTFASDTFGFIPGLPLGFFLSKIDLSVAVDSGNILQSY